MKTIPLLLAIVLGAAAAVSAEDWPTFHRDRARAGVTGETWAVASLQVAWTSEIDPESVDASPAIVGERLYVGTATGSVVCLNVGDGSVVWRSRTGGAVTSSPAVADGRVYVGSSDRCLYAFDAASGKRLWQVRTRGPVIASPLAIEGRVYCGSMDATFRCIDGATGKELWRVREAGAISAAAAAAGDVLYYGDETGHIIARGVADGKQVWGLQVEGGVVAAPSVAGDRLMVPVMSPTALSPPAIRCLLVLDRATGNEIWSLKQGSSVLHTPVTDGTNVYFATVSGYLSDTELLARRLADGAEVWKRRLGGVADSSPIIAGEMLLFGNHDRNFYVVHRGSGAVVQTLPLDEKMFSSPALSGGRVYIGLQGGKVVCLK